MIRFFASGFIAVSCLIGLIVVCIGAFFLTTPRPTNLRDCLTTTMFKVRLCPKDPGYVRLKEVSPYLRNAVIVSEDGGFYSHQGIDWFEVRESFEKNWQKGEFARGGSTITQQLAKNVYLSADKSLFRKAREVVIAVQIESLLSKDEILEKYLNVVEFGPEIFGIGRAARHYFNKSPSELNVAESSFLAFLLPSPKTYGVSFRKKSLTPFARSRMNQIIGRLLKFKKISDFEYEEARIQVTTFFGAPPETPVDEPATDFAEPSPEESEIPDDDFEPTSSFGPSGDT